MQSIVYRQGRVYFRREVLYLYSFRLQSWPYRLIHPMIEYLIGHKRAPKLYEEGCFYIWTSGNNSQPNSIPLSLARYPLQKREQQTCSSSPYTYYSCIPPHTITKRQRYYDGGTKKKGQACPLPYIPRYRLFWAVLSCTV